LIRRLLDTLRRVAFPSSDPDPPMTYWKKRARRFGRRSVLNLGHPEEAYDAVTRTQWERLLPLLREQLRGDERIVLDLGCGPGRFSVELARLTGGQVVAVDPIGYLLELAPPDPDVTYRAMDEGIIPVADASADLVWICLVLGGITDDAVLHRTAAEVRRVLRPGGLLFMVENTTDTEGSERWRFRPVAFYQRLFEGLDLRPVGAYDDLGERISVMAGRSLG